MDNYHLFISSCCFCQVIEGLFHVAAHTFNVVDTVYIMNHYSAGGILFSDRTELPRHSLPKVMCLVIVGLLVHGDDVGVGSRSY